MAIAQTTNPVVRNGSFEAASVGEHWTPHEKTPDGVSISASDDAKEGSRSLLVTAQTPARFSLDQEVFLKPGSLWRASVWVKYHTPSGSPALELDTPSGQQGASTAIGNARDWNEHAVIFRAPSPGRIHIRLRAFSDNSGKVWFDDVRLAPVPERIDQPERVTITDLRLSDRAIDLKQGGQFIEPLIRLTPSMIAQQVESTSFEEEPPWHPTYRAVTDKPFRPWYPDGAVHVATYSLDSHNAFNGKLSQKIDLLQAGVRAGISQDGYYLERAHAYRLRLHMRGSASIPIRAYLHGDGGVIAGPVELGKTAEIWSGAGAVLTAARNCSNATLTIEFRGPGTVWIDRIYMIDSDAVLGIWRHDVVGALKAMKPGVIRFGGSTLEVFEWDRCVGDWDRRVPYATNPWGGLDPDFIGVEEFVRLARHVEAEPLVCVRWTGKKPEDAFAEVQYLNGAPETTWGSVRSPERSSQAVRGEILADRKRNWRPRLRRIDQGVRRSDAQSRPYNQSPLVVPVARDVEAGRRVPGLPLSPPLRHRKSSRHRRQSEVARAANPDHSGGRDIRVAVTEWNTTAGEWGLTRGILQTLGNALGCSRYQNLLTGIVRWSRSRFDRIYPTASAPACYNQGQAGCIWHPRIIRKCCTSGQRGRLTTASNRARRFIDGYIREPDLSATACPDGMIRIFSVNSTATRRRVQVSAREGSAG